MRDSAHDHRHTPNPKPLHGAKPQPPPRGKIPFDIDDTLEKIRQAIKPYPPAMLQQLIQDGFATSFHQLIACVISIRTYDEVSLEASRRLFAKAPTPKKMAQLSEDEIDALIRPSMYHRQKAPRLKQIAERVAKEFQGELPCDKAVMLSMPGVGPKCAHLALGNACGTPFIGVDTHVHRVTNRWGYVQAYTPEKTMKQLEEKLPRKYWVEINKLLVPFGKHLCTPSRPRCSICPVLEMCIQVGVTAHR